MLRARRRAYRARRRPVAIKSGRGSGRLAMFPLSRPREPAASYFLRMRDRGAGRG